MKLKSGILFSTLVGTSLVIFSGCKEPTRRPIDTNNSDAGQPFTLGLGAVAPTPTCPITSGGYYLLNLNIVFIESTNTCGLVFCNLSTTTPQTIYAPTGLFSSTEVTTTLTSWTYGSNTNITLNPNNCILYNLPNLAPNDCAFGNNFLLNFYNNTVLPSQICIGSVLSYPSSFN